MELSFELIQKRIKKERKENLEILASVEKRLRKELLKLKIEENTGKIHLIDFIKVLCIKEKFNGLPGDEIINLIDCVF